MDFEKLLKVARNNELSKKEPVKCLQTKFKPPSKEQHERDRVLSEGVQRFLAKKELEEKKRQMEAEKRKQELLALRAKDPKATKRIQTMLKRTKSANKSVMEDAVDNNNTADTLAGPSQPDEDDYGFVSETSSQLYNELIQKMYSTPSDDAPKFAPTKKPSGTNLSNTKERVKMALLRQEEEERLPHKRKKKGKEKKEEDDDDDDIALDYGAPDRDLVSAAVDQNKAEKSRPKRQMPPPVDFQELLRIAEQKQHEPIVFEPKVKKPQEPELLMTKRQKMEYEKMQEWKRQRELRLQSLEKGDRSNSQEGKKPMSKIPKVNQMVTPQKKVNGQDDPINDNKVKSQERNSAKRIEKFPKGGNQGERKIQGQEKKQKDRDEETIRLIRERDEALRMLKKKEKLIRERAEAVRKLKEKEQLIRERDEAVRKLKLLEESERVKSFSKGMELSTSGVQKLPSGKTLVKNADNSKTNSSAGNQSFKGDPPARKNSVVKPEGRGVPNGSGGGVREFPPRDLKSSVKTVAQVGASRNLQRSKQFPPADVRRKILALKRRRIESDEEYDSELEDFIDDDDNDLPSEEVSKVISEIFKYDKNKYSRYDDADDECMESNFAQISKEEFFSTKCGILEDLKDIQREKAKLAKKQKR